MALDITWSRKQQHTLMEMVYGTTTVASCHLVCGQEVTLCEFLRYDLPPFYLLEGFQHHNLSPEVKYWKPFITRLQIYHYIMTTPTIRALLLTVFDITFSHEQE